jgi:coenzyme F420-0:L-glutamate ligase/coenzyme F420-1:gamma-L-glutamate ligase
MPLVRQQTKSSQGRAAAELSLLGLVGVPEVAAGDDLGKIVVDALDATGAELRDGDVLVVAQKIISKAEGRMVCLDDVAPSPHAKDLAGEVDKDPRLVELILSESSDVLRKRPGVLVVVHRLGVVLANAGIDSSNVGRPDERDRVLLLPEDPDRSCAALRAELGRRTGADVGVIVNDSIGRAWRLGTVGIALGVSGLPGLVDLRERPDMHGRALQVSETALADELAAAASLIMGQADEARPIVLARGVPYERRDGSARERLRPADLDLFR